MMRPALRILSTATKLKHHLPQFRVVENMEWFRIRVEAPRGLNWRNVKP
jgi:hypothetical protein